MVRAIAMFVVLLLVALFASLNWSAFTTSTPLSLIVTTVQAPLGLLLLGLIVFICLLFTAWVLSLQTIALREARRQTRELQIQRDLADSAEASRVAELRTELMGRLDRLQEGVRVALEQSTNSLAAQLGELDDRLGRSGLTRPT